MRTLVKDVMTREVVSVNGSTPFKDVAEAIIAHGVSSIPVVDGEGRVVGIVSEADLLYKEEFRELYYREGYHPPLRVRRRHRDAPARARGDRAAHVMTAPAITIRPEASTVAAARLMDERGVKRLVVTDAEDRLVGIVSRHDLLKVFLRPDAELVTEIRDEVLGRGLFVDITGVRISAHRGMVFLGGRMRHRSETESAASMSARVNGVVDVVNELTWDEDDTPRWGGR